MSDNFIDTKTNDNEDALEMSHQESYSVAEIAKTNFTALNIKCFMCSTCSIVPFWRKYCNKCC